ncbi:MAG: PIG-L deacetylase family protein [Acidimicrobiales bacterium]
MIVLARDATRELMSGNALVLAPHPDDDVFGCGALVAAMIRSGGSVTVAFATDGEGAASTALARHPGELAALRRTEAQAALAILGVGPERIHWFALGNGLLGERLEEAVALVLELVDQTRPANVFVSDLYDPHPDHRALSIAARRVAVKRPGMFRLFAYPILAKEIGPWPEASLRGVRLLGTVLGCGRRMGRPVRARVDTTEQKRRAVEAHASQTLAPTYTGEAVMGPRVVRILVDEPELFFSVDEAGDAPATPSSGSPGGWPRAHGRRAHPRR